MAKPLPLIIGGVGLTGAAAGGVYLVRGGASKAGDGNTVQTKTTENNPQSPGAVPTASAPAPKVEKFFDDVNAFKGDAKGSSCVKDLFGENFTISTDNVEDIGTGKPPTDTFFKNGDEEKKSCLVIQWKKKSQTGGGQKWNGKFTWLWAFTKGNEAFLTFNVAEPSSEDNKLKFTGVFYLVSKETSRWTVKYKKEVTENGKKVAKGEFDSHFPKAHSDVKGNRSDYWGFIQNKDPDVDKVCKAGDGGTCNGIDIGDVEVTKLKWTANKAGSKIMWSWSTSDDWWNKMYEVTEWKLKEKIAQIKGDWSEETVSPST